MMSTCQGRSASSTGQLAVAATIAALWILSAGAARGDPSTDTKPKDDQDLQEIVVTGSLIRTTDVRAFTPVMTISAEDIQAKGFADAAEALQRISYATGSTGSIRSASRRAPRS
jgi:iron complex outermembrane recepter protein